MERFNKASIKIVGGQAEIRTGYLLQASRKCSLLSRPDQLLANNAAATLETERPIMLYTVRGYFQIQGTNAKNRI